MDAEPWLLVTSGRASRRSPKGEAGNAAYTLLLEEVDAQFPKLYNKRMPNNRDDFPENTKITLAKRVGFHCSNPECNMPTCGPNEDVAKSTSIGVAAHISAASEGGARYDSILTSEERKAIDNGIWLCQSCSRLIDVDPEKYPKEILSDWKIQAEKRAGMRLNRQIANINIEAEWTAATGNDVEKILVNGYYEKELNGQKIRYFLDKEYLHVEHEPEPGIIAYYVLDKNGNVIQNKFPFPLEEYSFEIDENMILSKKVDQINEGFTVEQYLLKWNMAVTIIRNKDGNISHFNANKNCSVNHVEKKLFIKNPFP